MLVLYSSGLYIEYAKFKTKYEILAEYGDCTDNIILC